MNTLKEDTYIMNTYIMTPEIAQQLYNKGDIAEHHTVNCDMHLASANQ